SAREASAEKPVRVDSSAGGRLLARERNEPATTATIKKRRTINGTMSPRSEKGFCTKHGEDKKAEARENAGLARLLVRGVQNFVGDAQAFDGQVVHDVRLDDLVDVRGLNAAVEYALGIDRDGRTELALVEAAGLIGANQFDAPLGELNLEQALQFAAT